MSARRALAASAVAVALPASLLIGTSHSSASEKPQQPATTTSKVAAGQKATLSALPQIAQKGRRTANSSAAESVLTATVSPARAGRAVRLQEQVGTRWKTVSTKRTDRTGTAEFTRPASTTPRTFRAVVASTAGAPAITTSQVSNAKWTDPTWSDEFNGSSLSSDWSHRGRTYEPYSMRKCSKGSPQAAKVKGGSLRLSVIRDKSKGKKLCVAKKNGKVTGKFAYRLNGHVGTENKASLRYGIAAARIKMHKLRGQHGGFWMQPVANSITGPGPSAQQIGAEIDIIEYFGDRHPNGGLTSFIYSKNSAGKPVKTGSWIKNSKSFLKNKKDGWSKNYHVFSVEWTPQEYIFRIDGKISWRTNVGVSGVQQYPILSLLASDYELYQMKDRQLPQTMQVDWIKLWQA